MSFALWSAPSAIVDQLAELTRYRDRDLLDVTLAGAFREILKPRSLAIYRKVGASDDARWMTRARLGPADIVPTSDPVWTLPKDMPSLTEHPARLEALSGRAVILMRNGLSVSLFPLSTDREIAGVLELETEEPLDADAERVVRSVLHVYRNFESLLDYSERDTLTGLLNRKTFDMTLLKIVSSGTQTHLPPAPDCRGVDASVPYWVGMIDIDHFKSVNDRFGHLIGDEVLLLQSRLMRSSFRWDDRLYRFGGEEFVALVRCATRRDAARVFERLRLNTERFAFPQVERVTVSIGFAEVGPGDSPSSALGRADQAVYYAKRHGRNQVQSYADLVARGEIEDMKHRIGEVDLF